MDFDRVPSAAELDAATPRASRSPADEDDDAFGKLRKSQPIERLLPVAKQWFGRLPPTVSANALATQYPRIANVLATQWTDRQASARYFDDLLCDRRGGRQGFPPAVHDELVKLRDYWYSGHAFER